jgi:hypothetical protein
MQRETLMSQVMTEHCQKNAHNMPVLDELVRTWTNPQSMKWLADMHSLRCDVYKNQFHMVKFVPYIDESGEEDAEMIEHDFYF